MELCSTDATLQGAPATQRFDTDHEPLVRQESFFQWAFGAKVRVLTACISVCVARTHPYIKQEPDLFGAVDVATGRSTLFIPRLPEAYAVWMGAIRCVVLCSASVCVCTRWTDGTTGRRRTLSLRTLWTSVASLTSCRASSLLTAHYCGCMARIRVRCCLGVFDSYAVSNRLHFTDSGSTAEPATFEGIEKFRRDDGTLFSHIVELRVIKTALELDVLRYVAGVSSAAHTQVMREVRPGMMECVTRLARVCVSVFAKKRAYSHSQISSGGVSVCPSVRGLLMYFE